MPPPTTIWSPDPEIEETGKEGEKEDMKAGGHKGMGIEWDCLGQGRLACIPSPSRACKWEHRRRRGRPCESRTCEVIDHGDTGTLVEEDDLLAA